MSQAITTNDEYDAAIAGNAPVIIKCWAHFCKPCVDGIADFEEVAAGLSAHGIASYTLDIESVFDFRDIDRVTKLPTFLLARRGEIIAEAVGASGLKMLRDLARG